MHTLDSAAAELDALANHLVVSATLAGSEAELNSICDVADLVRHAAREAKRFARRYSEEPRCVRCERLPVAADEFVLCGACRVA